MVIAEEVIDPGTRLLWRKKFLGIVTDITIPHNDSPFHFSICWVGKNQPARGYSQKDFDSGELEIADENYTPALTSKPTPTSNQHEEFVHGEIRL